MDPFVKGLLLIILTMKYGGLARCKHKSLAGAEKRASELFTLLPGLVARQFVLAQTVFQNVNNSCSAALS